MAINSSNKTIVYPSGNTANRPTAVNNGYIYFNTTTGTGVNKYYAAGGFNDGTSNGAIANSGYGGNREGSMSIGPGSSGLVIVRYAV
jgi:hypothetical protein